MACQSVTSMGFTPIPDMSAVATYNGHLGRLYEDGGTPTNNVPVAHDADLLTAMGNVEKLDSSGNPSPTGKIVVIATGMSNARQKWAEFMRDVPDRNPAIVLVNGAQTNRTAAEWADNDSDVWATMNTALAAKSVNRLQVQVVWLEHAIGGPTGDFATHLAQLMGYYKQIIQNLGSFFPNAQLLFWSPRTYGGYSTTGNPEPYAYETGYAVRDIILEQTAGTDPDLAIGAASPVTDFASGTIITGAGTIPAMAWATYIDAGQWEGAYWWSDGETANTQGLESFQADYEADCLHPAGDDDGVFAPDGMEHKAAARLEAFFENSPYTNPWWFPPITPVVVDSIQSNTTASSYTSAAAYTPPANEIQIVFVFSRAATAPNQPTVTGHSITYTFKDRQSFATIASPGGQVAVFEGAAIASPTNTVLAVDFGGQNQTCCIVIAVSVPQIYVLAQTVKKNATDSANSLQVALDAQTDEVFVIAAFADIVGAAFTPKAGWTELSDLDTSGAPVGRLEVQYITPYDTPAEGTRSGAGDMAIGAVVLAYEGPPPSYLLEVTTDPTDGGTITSSPAGINYPSDPDHEYIEGTDVDLTATANPGYIFVGWSGDFDSAVGNVATVEMDEAKQITALFRAIEAGDMGKRPQSGRNSRHWSVYLPTGLGPFDGFAALRCGDLEQVRDNLRVLPGSVYGRDMAVTGRRKELARVSDESQMGSLTLSCTEEAARALDLMRTIGCPFPIQRRTCLPTPGIVAFDPTTSYEHYSAVNLGERNLDNPTAGGLDRDDGTPSVTFPGVYGRRYPLTDSHPGKHDFVDDEESTIETLLGVVYCYNPLCGDCGLPCDRLYALIRSDLGESEFLLSLQRSEDGGASWEDVVLPFSLEQPEGFIFCYQGSRLFVGDESGITYYSDDPDSGEWYELVQLGETLSGGYWVSKMVSDGYTIFAVVGDANQTGIIRSVDGGLTWEFVVQIDTLTAGQFTDITIAGDVVMAYGTGGGGQGEISFSYRKGDFQTWTQVTNAAWPDAGAIAAANPNPFDESRAWFYVLGADGADDIQIWKGSSDAPDLMELIHEVDYDPAVTWLLYQIFLDGDGYIGWFHASQSDGTSITLRTSTGGDRFVDVSLDTVSEEEEGRAILAVCPHDPDVGFIGYTASMPF